MAAAEIKHEEVEQQYVLVTDPDDGMRVELPLNEEYLPLSLLQHYFPGAVGLGFLPPSSHSDVMRCLVMRDGNLLPPSGGWKENIEYKVIKKTVCRPADNIESRTQRIQKAILDVKQLAQSKNARKLHVKNQEDCSSPKKSRIMKNLHKINIGWLHGTNNNIRQVRTNEGEGRGILN